MVVAVLKTADYAGSSPVPSAITTSRQLHSSSDISGAVACLKLLSTVGMFVG